MTQTVKEILQQKSAKIYSVAAETAVYSAIELMAEANISAVLIVDGEKLLGIFTERDYARKVILQGRNSREAKISEVMTQNLLTISPSQTVEDVMEMMTRNRIRHLPVVERGSLVGIVTIGDAVKAVIDEQQQTILQLSSYISGDIATP